MGVAQAGHEGGQGQRRVGPALVADDGGQLAHQAVAGHAGGDVAGGHAGQAGKLGQVGQVAMRYRKRSATAGPVKGSSQLSCCNGAALLQRKDLCQHRVVVLHGQAHGVVVWPGVGKDHVQDLQTGASAGQLRHQAGLGGARPGPGADVAQAALVNVNNNQAAFVAAVGPQAPGQVGRAFLKCS